MQLKMHAFTDAAIHLETCMLATDRPKKEVQLVVDVVVHALPGEPQQAPLIMVSGCAWSQGVYRALRLQGKTLDIAWERAFVRSLTFQN
jgi:hypothetical protein